MKPEKNRLIHDLLDEPQGERREATLRAGGQILRWRRRRNVAVRCFAVLAILGIAALCFEKMRPTQSTIASTTPPPMVKTQKAALTDQELLALFPDTPIALATLENGKKRLIFPRAADEKRLITRL